MYKIIAIDLDGTLLNSEGEISAENKNAINLVKQKGIEIVLTSGRVSASVLNFEKELSAGRYFICGNGSMVYDMQKNQIIYKNVINKKEILKIIKICEKNAVYYSISTEETIIASSVEYNVAAYNYENIKKERDKKTRINIVKDVYSYVERSKEDRYLKMTVCDSDKVKFEKILRNLKEIPKISILDVEHKSKKKIMSENGEIDISYYYTEITNKNVDKWQALKEICKIENIEDNEIVAIGDNMNDFCMIKNAGYGIVMENGMPILKYMANFVTKDNNNDGVAVGIRKILAI